MPFGHHTPLGKYVGCCHFYSLLFILDKEEQISNQIPF